MINSDQILDLVNKYRPMIQQDTETIGDAALVSAFVFMTFSMQHLPQEGLGDQLPELMKDMSTQVVALARELGFTLETGH